jgi:hypothetical protein
VEACQSNMFMLKTVCGVSGYEYGMLDKECTEGMMTYCDKSSGKKKSGYKG